MASSPSTNGGGASSVSLSERNRKDPDSRVRGLQLALDALNNDNDGLNDVCNRQQDEINMLAGERDALRKERDELQEELDGFQAGKLARETLLRDELQDELVVKLQAAHDDREIALRARLAKERDDLEAKLSQVQVASKANESLLRDELSRVTSLLQHECRARRTLFEAYASLRGTVRVMARIRGPHTDTSSWKLEQLDADGEVGKGGGGRGGGGNSGRLLLKVRQPRPSMSLQQAGYFAADKGKATNARKNDTWHEYNLDRVFDHTATDEAVFSELRPVTDAVAMHGGGGMMDVTAAVVIMMGASATGKSRTMRAILDGVDATLWSHISMQNPQPRVSLAVFCIYEDEKMLDLVATAKAAARKDKKQQQQHEQQQERADSWTPSTTTSKDSKEQLNISEYKMITALPKEKRCVGIPEGCTWDHISSAESFAKARTDAEKFIITKGTGINPCSSRGHVFYVLSIQQAGPPGGGEGEDGKTPPGPASTLMLVDLAGNERQKNSMVQGQEAKEARAINMSLSNLSTVLEKMGKGDMRGAASHAQASLLTRVLAGMLGLNNNNANNEHAGNSSAIRLPEPKLTVIATVALDDDATALQAINTLDVAQKAATITLAKPTKLAKPR